MRKIIAVIDDDRAIRNGVSSLLRSAGLDVRLYENAESFLNEGVARKADAAITDIQMPGMSGLDLQETLKDRQPDLPVLFMTAFPEDALRQRAMARGAVCFLSKPFNAADLLFWIEKATAPAGRGQE
ncbi:response regulator transcription factor [Uliginosibacterium sp. H1]|uniref:response regulator transcription factor n=1 Tax=Uliginosibacterium sp. H1 TaxID=3114757 RepID=UPI002E17616C|nr:response regulator [Uliginosibacterium sp. H1]